MLGSSSRQPEQGAQTHEEGQEATSQANQASSHHPRRVEALDVRRPFGPENHKVSDSVEYFVDCSTKYSNILFGEAGAGGALGDLIMFALKCSYGIGTLQHSKSIAARLFARTEGISELEVLRELLVEQKPSHARRLNPKRNRKPALK